MSDRHLSQEERFTHAIVRPVNSRIGPGSVTCSILAELFCPKDAVDVIRTANRRRFDPEVSNASAS